MPRFKVLISAPYLLPFMDRFRPYLEARGCEVVTVPVEERLEESDLLAIIGDIDGVVCGDDRFTARVIAAAPELKVLSKWGTGIDSIDQVAAQQHGVVIRNVPNAFSEPVADTVLGWMLAFARGVVSQTQHMRAGGWTKLPGHALNECCVAIIGLGNCGMAVARRARAFGMKILGVDPGVVDSGQVASLAIEMTELQDALSRADYVTVNCDLNPSSYHLIRTETLAWMRPQAVLINAARGPIVCEADLVAALQAGQIRGAGLDVFEDEPLPQSSPLRGMENVFLSSHNANSSPKAWEAVHVRAIENMLTVLEARQG